MRLLRHLCHMAFVVVGMAPFIVDFVVRFAPQFWPVFAPIPV
jgi:hypothetical protein